MAKKVLFGDDDSIMRGFVKEQLEGDGIAGVDAVAFPEKVVSMAQQNQYDAIITDLDYGGEDEGYDVLEKVRELAPIRVLCSHAAHHVGVMEKAKQHGATHVVEKLEFDRLVEIIKGE